MKRFSLLLGLALVLSLVFAGAAYANFGPHGGYISDTDSCAGCHRAHTSFSSVTFEPKTSFPGDPQPSALLVGSASTMSEFCNACHGDAAPGASTNVVNGVFDAGPSGANGQGIGASNGGVTVAYQTASTFNGPLNGGGFQVMPDPDSPASLKAVSSAHSMEAVGTLWGAGNASDQSMNLTCTSCHDPHGSSNYRLLKDSVNNVTVGGYDSNDLPTGMVFSAETNYPDKGTVGGWLKHADGQTQMAAYRPDYTGGTKVLAGTAGNSLSTWCSACHTRYNQKDDTVASGGSSYGAFEGNGGVGTKNRHRHPVDISVGFGVLGNQTLFVQPVRDSRIPLEVAGNPDNDQIGCLTCHFAHGSAADMSGWSNAHLTQNASGTWVPSRDTTPGVEPDKAGTPGLQGGAPINGSSALLRADNRGVCERCHNK